MASSLYYQLPALLGYGWFTMESPVSAVLVSSAYTPNLADHSFGSDVVAHEVSGTGYTAGGQALSNQQWGLASANSYRLTADPLSWTGVSVTFRYLVYYFKVGSDWTTNRLLGFFDTGTDEVLTAQDLNFVWNTTYGVLTMVV